MSDVLHGHHRAMLEQESGINPEVVAARGYRTSTIKAELERLGFSRNQCNVPSLLIPIYGPAGDVRLYQARPDTPRINKGKPVKYETPAGSTMALDVPPAARSKMGDPSTPLFITEGIKKGDKLVSHGLCAVALVGVWSFRGKNAQGGKTALPEWEFIALNDRRVYIVFDSDVMLKKEVHAALVRLKAFLEHRKAKVSLIYLPTGDGAVKQGVDDYLAAGHSIDDLLARASPDVKQFDKTDTAERGKAEGTGRPEIIVNGRFLRDIAADAMGALTAANEPPFLFMRGTVPARVNGDKVEALTAVSLKGVLDRCADYLKKVINKHGKEELTPARPPSDLAPDLLTSTSLNLPPLEDIVHAPVFLPGGALLAEDGYHPESGLLLRLKTLENLRADMPTDKAVALLHEVFGQFPFTEQAGWAHTLSMVLQPLVRPLIRGATPMYLIDAPARGTGKGLLAEAACLICLGYVVPTMSQPNDGDELEKRLTSVLLEARAVVFFDNVTRLASPHHAAILTSEVWQGRILGKSETVTMPNRALWLASGNNVTLSDEMVRRIIPIRLDAGVERPEERSGFKHAPLAEYVRAHRSELVSACLSLVQAWIDAGTPKGTGTLGRYEAWAGIMGGILEVSGVSGFLGGRERLHAEADNATKEWAALCAAWWSSYEVRPVTAKDLFDIMKSDTLLLDLWGGRTAQGALQRIGHALAARRDRVFGDYKIVTAGRDGVTRSAAYQLTISEPGGPFKTTETTETTDEGPETTSETQKEASGFISGFAGGFDKTTDKPPQNHQERNSVQDGEKATPPVVSVVSVVLNRPHPPENIAEDDDLSHLVGATEGEL